MVPSCQRDQPSPSRTQFGTSFPERTRRFRSLGAQRSFPEAQARPAVDEQRGSRGVARIRETEQPHRAGKLARSDRSATAAASAPARNDAGSGHLDRQQSASEHRFVKFTAGVTMATMAEAAGVVRSTVSKARRDDPTITLVRRREIQRRAKTLGCRPKPTVSALMARLHRRRRRNDRHHRAWIDLWAVLRDEVWCE